MIFLEATDIGAGRVARLAPRPARAVALGLLAWTVPTAVAPGDQIVVDAVSYPRARIAGLEDGRLLFHTVDGKPKAIWLSDIDSLIVDQAGMFADFNQAERYLDGGEPEKAIIRYRRTLRRSEGFWSELIAARLVIACDRADRLDQATLNYVRVVRGEWTGPALAVRLIPEMIPSTRTAKAVHAVEHLEAAITDNLQPERRIPLEWLRYEIMRRSGDGRVDAAAHTVATLAVPAALRGARVSIILLAALEHVPQDEAEGVELDGLNRAILECPEKLLPGFLLLKGQTLLKTASTREDFIRASWPLLRIAIHMPDDPRAAEGLYGAALAVERMGREDKAADLLAECLAHKRLDDEIRLVAEAALARLRPGGATSP